MKQWEAEDTEYPIEFAYNPTESDDYIWKLRRWENAAPIPMTSSKNLSPKRVAKRRRQKTSAGVIGRTIKAIRAALRMEFKLTGYRHRMRRLVRVLPLAEKTPQAKSSGKITLLP